MAKGKKIQQLEEQYGKAEKEYLQPLSKDNLDDDVFNALDVSLVDEATLPINKIIPDPTQPRRIIPYQFLDYVGDGHGAVIAAWEEYVFDATDDFPTVDILEGKKAAGDYVNDDPIVIEFAEMVSFAANIHDIGLSQAIGVVTRGDAYRIIYGERRWTAFQFLHHYLGGYENIPAKIANVSEWELAKMQSAENFQRPELNAIAKARMFAKLLMIARSDGGERYDSWNQLVVPGKCDRQWYAQVANGELHPIPRGLGTQFESALNISTAQMRQYRNLLRLFDKTHNVTRKVNDAIWMLGDAGDWSENFMREVGQYLQVDDVDTILNGTNGYTVTAVTVSMTEDALREAVASAKEVAESKKKTSPPQPPLQSIREGEQAPPDPVDKSLWASYQWVGREAMVGDTKVFVVNCKTPSIVSVEYRNKFGQDVQKELSIASLTPIVTPPKQETSLYESTDGSSDNANTQQPETTFSYVDKNGVAIVMGAKVITRRGAEAVVVGFNGRYVEVESDNKFLAKGHYPEWLEVVPSQKALTPSPSPSGRGEQIPTETALEKSAYPDMVGKPLLWDGQPVFGVSKTSETEMLVQLGNGDREEVDMDELVINGEAMKSSPTETAKKNGALQGLVFAEDDEIRRYLEPYRVLSIVLDNEHATAAIEWLQRLTYERTNRQQLDAAMSHVMTHIEDINKSVEGYVFERFRVKLEEVEYGGS